MKFCRIDLHSNNRVIVVSDAEDRTVLQRIEFRDHRHSREHTDAAQRHQRLDYRPNRAGVRGCLDFAVEAGHALATGL
ncbi:MAG: hypothetical protein QOC89_2583, partial [Paraburkholderia sp.]|nr:hypothetical protein [Paraburkholderia sp.]